MSEIELVDRIETALIELRFRFAEIVCSDEFLSKHKDARDVALLYESASNSLEISLLTIERANAMMAAALLRKHKVALSLVSMS